jgi:hypothetical protein
MFPTRANQSSLFSNGSNNRGPRDHRQPGCGLSHAIESNSAHLGQSSHRLKGKLITLEGTLRYREVEDEIEGITFKHRIAEIHNGYHVHQEPRGAANRNATFRKDGECWSEAFSI